MRVLAVAALLALGGLLATAAVSRGATAFATGTYVGRTAQKQVIRFKVAAAKCDSPRPPYAFHRGICFEGVVYNARLAEYYPLVQEPCSDGTTYSDPLYVASYNLSFTSTGYLKYTVRGLGLTLTDNGSLSTMTIQVKGRTATGSLHQTESYDTGNGPVYCDSKVVKFTAHRVG